MISGCFLNVATEEDSKGVNSWIEFKKDFHDNSLMCTLTLDGKKVGVPFRLPKHQVSFFMDVFDSWSKE